MIIKIFKPFMILVCSLLLFLGLMEGALRLMGYEPFHPKTNNVHPKGFEFDPELGWRLIPGSYKLSPFRDKENYISMIIKEDTGRVTRVNNLGVGENQITFIGGSFMMGHGLNNNQTMAWKLQERFPQIDFRNLSVSAYGTYQSLIVLEKEINKGQKPKCIIYGAFEHHSLRNVAQGNWLMELHKKVPHVILLNDSTFARKGLIGMRQVRLKTKLATAYLAEKVLNRVLSYKRVKNAQRLSYLLMKEMHKLCLRHQITFYVAPLQYSPSEMTDLTSFLEENEINYIDCNVTLTLDNIIKDDGHPGESVNDIWAERIGKRLVKDGIIDIQ